MKDNGLRGNAARYTQFVDRMTRAVNGKTRYNPNSTTKLFEDLISPSQEAFALLLWKNGYENWMWMHDQPCITSDGSNVTAEEHKRKGTMKAVLIINIPKGVATSQAGMEDGQGRA